MWRLVPVLVAEMGQAFSELVRAEPLITEVLRLEETRFRETLERGLRLLEEATAGLAAGAVLPGETAFRLYDTYGFPLDLTEDALRARGMTVDKAGFDGRDGAPARRGARELEGLGRAGRGARLVRAARDARRHRVPRLRARDRRGPGQGAGGRRPAGRARRARRRGHGGHQPDAVLRRVGRPDRRYRHDPARPGGGPGQRHPEEASATSTSTSAGSRAARSRSATRSSSRSTASAARACAGRTRRRTCCTRRCAATSAPRDPEGLAGRARPPALRLQPPEARDARRAGRDRGRGQRVPAPERRGQRSA